MSENGNTGVDPAKSGRPLARAQFAHEQNMPKPVVLIVQGEALIRIGTIHMVEDAGFSVLEASNADDAIRLLKSCVDIRAVLIGIGLPGAMDGLKLAHAVRDRWPPAHLIVTSGREIQDKLPANSRFIRKPYTAEHVTAALRALFGPDFPPADC